MNQKEIDLAMAAAGYPKRKFSRRKPRIKLDLDDPEILRKMEILKIKGTLESVGGHRLKASKLLGIHVRTLYKWLKKLEN